MVLLGVCTPTWLAGWPVDTQVLLDCAYDERRRLGVQAGPDHVRHVVRDGSGYQLPGLPVLDSPGRLPATFAAQLAQFIAVIERAPQQRQNR